MTNETKPKAKPKVKEQVITDITYDLIGRDKDGNEEFEKKYYNGDKLVKTEVVNDIK